MSNHVHVHRGKDLTVTLTFRETLEAISPRWPCSPKSLRRYLKTLKIKPVNKLHTKPHRYTADTPALILNALGDRVVTMSQLKAVKRQAQKARAA